MKWLNCLVGGIVVVLACLVYFLPALGLGALLLGGTAFLRQEDARWQQREPQDRADFERTFPVPAYMGPTAPDGALQIRRTKIAHILLGEARQILSLEQELNRLEYTDAGSSFQEQVAQATDSKKKLDGLMKKFATDVRLANRFDNTGLYEDIDDQFKVGYGMNGAFCFIVDKLQKQDLSGFPFSGNISPPPGCSE